MPSRPTWLLPLFVPAGCLLLSSPSFAATPTGWSLESTVDGGTTAIGSSIATTETVAVVGAPFAGAGGSPPGAVYVYSNVASPWSATTLVAPTPVPGGDFGSSVAASNNLVAIGAPGSPPAAYAFTASGGTYTCQKTWVDPTGDKNASFGGAVAAYAGATGPSYVAIAAPPGSTDPIGTVYVSTQADGGAWSDPPVALTDSSAQAFGIAVAFTSTGQLLVGDPGTGTGQVLIYTASGAAWTSAGTLPAPVNGGNIQQFGSAIATWGNLVVVTAPGSTGGSATNGTAFVFASDSMGNWTQQGVLAGSSAETFGNFGVSLQGDLLAIGSAINGATSGAGQVDVWTSSGTSWLPVAASTLVGDAYYGQAVGFVGTTLFVGDTSALGASSVADVTSSLRIYGPTYGGDAGEPGADGGFEDASAEPDAATGTEGGPTTTPVDAGRGGSDAGVAPASTSKSGCSCDSVTGRTEATGLALLAQGAIVAAFVRRRRRQ